MIWWILLFGVSAEGVVQQLAFLRTSDDVVTYEQCQAIIPTLNVSLSQRGGLASCLEAPEGVALDQFLGKIIPIPR